MAARRVTRRASGRLRVALLLVGFVLVASAVIVRRTIGARHARDLLALNRTRASLIAERARLVSEIGVATSLARLEPLVAQRLGMHRPTDAQLVRIPREAPRAP